MHSHNDNTHRITKSYDIGHSVKTPCPNLKKLIVPASTTATTTIFFPVLSEGKGLEGRGCAVCVFCGPNHDQNDVLDVTEAIGVDGCFWGFRAAVGATSFC